jgi:hypothetical protein
MPRLRQPQADFAAVSRLLIGYGATGISVSNALGCAPATARKKLAEPKRFTLGELSCLGRKYGIPFEEIRAAMVK